MCRKPKQKEQQVSSAVHGHRTSLVVQVLLFTAPNENAESLCDAVHAVSNVRSNMES
jgi:hypothetical protein